MGIETVALLRIANLPAPTTADGTVLVVEHRGDASLVHTLDRFHALRGDDHALALRQLLGPDLDAHHDPRGVLFFPDLCQLAGSNYETLVAEVGTAGLWASKVHADYVPAPARYRSALVNSHEALVARMVDTMGRDEATVLDLVAGVNLVMLESGARPDATERFRAEIEKVVTAMGDAFASLYERSLRRKVAQQLAAQTNELERRLRL